MTIEEIYALHPDEDGWRILDTGNRVKLGNEVTLGDWVKLGNEVTLGDWVKLGDWVTLGNRVKLGDWVTLGNGVTLGNRVKLGNEVTLGNGVKLGDWVTLGNRVKLGNEVTLGDRVNDVVDLGYCEQYRKAISCVEGVAWISAGCRWFTLADALKHWADREDRPMTRALMLAAVEIARLKGWRHE